MVVSHAVETGRCDLKYRGLSLCTSAVISASRVRLQAGASRNRKAPPRAQQQQGWPALRSPSPPALSARAKSVRQRRDDGRASRSGGPDRSQSGAKLFVELQALRCQNIRSRQSSGPHRALFPYACASSRPLVAARSSVLRPSNAAAYPWRGRKRDGSIESFGRIKSNEDERVNHSVPM